MTPLLKAMPLLLAVFFPTGGVVTVWVADPPPPFLFFVSTATLYFSLTTWAASRCLMDEVWLDETSLLIRKGAHEERVDLLNVLKIRDHFKWGQPRITITLEATCSFGPTIAFCAKGMVGNHVLLRRNAAARQLAVRIEALRDQAGR